MTSVVIAESYFGANTQYFAMAPISIVRGVLPPHLEIRQNDFRDTAQKNFGGSRDGSCLIFINNQPGTHVTLDRNMFPSGRCHCSPVNGVQLKIVGTKEQIGAHALENAEKEWVKDPRAQAQANGAERSKVVLEILD